FGRHDWRRKYRAKNYIGSGRRMSIRLSITVSEGPNRGETFDSDAAEFVVGRSRADFKLSDKKVSGKHCRILIEDNKVFVEDLGSTNGTFVGGRKIESATQIHNLDEIIVGLTKLSVAIVE